MGLKYIATTETSKCLSLFFSSLQNMLYEILGLKILFTTYEKDTLFFFTQTSLIHVSDTETIALKDLYAFLVRRQQQSSKLKRCVFRVTRFFYNNARGYGFSLGVHRLESDALTAYVKRMKKIT